LVRSLRGIVSDEIDASLESSLTDIHELLEFEVSLVGDLGMVWPSLITRGIGQFEVEAGAAAACGAGSC